MLQMVSGTREQLRVEVEVSLAQYRYRVFVQELGWPLKTEHGLERDAFDRDDTVYVVARNNEERVCGCGRLLPTTRPYLLSEVFPHLMGGAPLPHASDVWELSRFAISSPSDAGLSVADAWRNTCALMADIVRVAASLGAKRLIAFSVVGNERLLRRMGVDVHRAAAPQLLDGKPVLPFWIEINTQTTTALGITLSAGDLPAVMGGRHS